MVSPPFMLRFRTGTPQNRVPMEASKACATMWYMRLTTYNDCQKQTRELFSSPGTVGKVYANLNKMLGKQEA